MSKYRASNKLTATQVKAIRRRAEKGEKGNALARAFNVSPASISLIIRGRVWSDVQGPLKELPPRTDRAPVESQERWRPVPGYEDLYSVSDLGNIRIEVSRRNIRAGTHLRQTRDPEGYLSVCLTDTKHPRYHRVSLVVLAAFIGPRPPGQETNHKDGNRQNNCLKNLEYVTKAQNIRHSIEELGSTRQGASNPAAKLTAKQVGELRERAAAGETYPALGRAFDITNVMARNIATGKSWKNVGGPIQGKRRLGRPPRNA